MWRHKLFHGLTWIFIFVMQSINIQAQERGMYSEFLAEIIAFEGAVFDQSELNLEFQGLTQEKSKNKLQDLLKLRQGNMEWIMTKCEEPTILKYLERGAESRKLREIIADRLISQSGVRAAAIWMFAKMHMPTELEYFRNQFSGRLKRHDETDGDFSRQIAKKWRELDLVLPYMSEGLALTWRKSTLIELVNSEVK